MIILNGKDLAIKELIQINEFTKNHHINLLLLSVGNDSSRDSYKKSIIATCQKANINCIAHHYDEISENDFLNIIRQANVNRQIHGIMILMPLPANIDEHKVSITIDPNKDIDCFNPINVGKLFLGLDTIKPCTPKAIMELIDEYKIECKNKHVVVVGRSNIVGKPIAHLMLERNATVSICHSHTLNLEHFTRQADILIVAIGQGEYIKANHLKENSVVIDVGINFKNGKLVGDVDFIDCQNKAMMISPVPGGVGPLTNIALIKNLIKCYERNLRNE